MKDLSFFFLKNLMGAKMGRGFRNFCNNDNSTSTLNQRGSSAPSQVPSSSSCMGNDDGIVPNAPPRKSVTLEEMIMQLELEEAIARKEKTGNCKCKEEEEAEEIRSKFHHRMSCVNNSDILRSARSALNQYPRFSLDGRESRYRSSFRTNVAGPTNIDGALKLGRILHLPKSLGGESVIWCKPGLVPKLMGLEAMPMSIGKLNHSNNKKRHDKQDLCNIIRNQNLRRRAQRNEMERREKRHVTDPSVCCGNTKRSSGRGGGGSTSSSTSIGYCVMNPIAMDPVLGVGGSVSWPTPCNYS